MTLPAPVPMSATTNAYDLLSFVAQIIAEEPLRVDQGDWIQDTSYWAEPLADQPERRAPACNTVGCIAGWVVISIDGREDALKETHGSIASRCIEILGYDSNVVDEDDARASEEWRFHTDLRRLFTGHVHREFQELHPNTPEFLRPRAGTPEYAVLVVHRIKKFQAKWEARLRATSVNRT